MAERVVIDLREHDVHCLMCGAIPCPHCGSFSGRITSGSENYRNHTVRKRIDCAGCGGRFFVVDAMTHWSAIAKLRNPD